MQTSPKVQGIPAADAVRASVSFDQLRRAGDVLYWLESRPAVGASTLVCWHPESGKADVSPPGFDVASRVHAYGGGPYAVTDDQVWCVDGHGLHRLRDGESDYAPMAGSFGDLTVSGGELLGVRESDAGDALVAVSLQGARTQPRVLLETAGFVAAPRPGPDMLAWSQWSTHDMPWDTCELWVAAYAPGGRLGEPVKLAGGPQESAVEPRWGPDGALYFVSDRSGWWNLCRWDGTAIEAIAPMAAECAAEPWELGYSSYDFLGDGRIVMAVQRGPRHALIVVDHAAQVVQEIPTPYTSIKPYLVVWRESVALVGSSPTVAPQVALVHLDPTEVRVEVLASAEHAELDTRAVSEPVELQVATGNGRSVTAILYPPTGAGQQWRAPVIVRAHPGPTASALLRLDWQAQFFTSRGFAIVDVDYTGSTGYGRAFRQALYGRWGVDDVADCRAVAEHLLAAGHAIEGQVFIRGASAGGYTALHSVAGDGPFAAATAVSAIVDPDRWATTVPRFQRAHAARLRGGAGAIRAADVCQPVLLVHGSADEVAVPGDVLDLAERLSRRRVPHELLLLEGVGHYVASSRQAATALEAELAHYQRVISAAVVG